MLRRVTPARRLHWPVMPAPNPTPAIAPQAHDLPRHAKAPLTLWLGLALLGIFHALLWLDLANRDGVVIPWDGFRDDVDGPWGRLGTAARYVAANMTPLCWLAYLLVADGLLTWLARCRRDPAISSLRSRPHRLLFAWLTSIPVWCFFDWVNFTWLDAWRYHGLPEPFAARLVGYFVAFAAIVPGMLLAGQLYQHLGLRRWRVGAGLGGGGGELVPWLGWTLVLGPPGLIVVTIVALYAAGLGPAEPGDWYLATTLGLLVGPPLVLGLALPWRAWRGHVVSLGIGVGFVAWVFYVRQPVANLALWVGLIYLLDPINRCFLGQPSLVADWVAGRLGRTAALFAGGLTCGLLWELWNYWALAKWTYNLPFLGPWETWRYFEMPLPGMLGFLPFAAQCWVILHTLLGVTARLGVRVAEPLPDEKSDVI